MSSHRAENGAGKEMLGAVEVREVICVKLYMAVITGALLLYGCESKSREPQIVAKGWDASSLRENQLEIPVAEKMNRGWYNAVQLAIADFAHLRSPTRKNATWTSRLQDEDIRLVRRIVEDTLEQEFVPQGLARYSKKSKTGDRFEVSYQYRDPKSGTSKRFLIMTETVTHGDPPSVTGDLLAQIYVDGIEPMSSAKELYSVASKYLKLPPMEKAEVVPGVTGDPMSRKLIQSYAKGKLSDEEADKQLAEYPRTRALLFKNVKDEWLTMRGGKITIEEKGAKRDVNAIILEKEVHR